MAASDLQAGVQVWLEQFGSATLSSGHAASLTDAAHATVQAVADAARQLDWLEADVFLPTLQNLKPGHEH